jgi:transketolase
VAKIDNAIAKIEASTNTPKLISLKDFIANASKGNP